MRRYIGGKLFDVLPDGTSVEMPSLLPPRSLPIMILKGPVTVPDAIGEFLLSFAGISVDLPGIVAPIPAITPPPEVPIIIGPGEPPPPEIPPPPGQPPPVIVPPPEVPSDTIITRFGVPPSGIVSAIIANFPGNLWVQAAEISFRESGWDGRATNDTRHYAGGQCNVSYLIPSLNIWALTEWSIGLFQINICAHGGSPEHWYDPMTNAAKAIELYHANGDWSAWAYTARSLGLRQHVL